MLNILLVNFLGALEKIFVFSLACVGIVGCWYVICKMFKNIFKNR